MVGGHSRLDDLAGAALVTKAADGTISRSTGSPSRLRPGHCGRDRRGDLAWSGPRPAPQTRADSPKSRVAEPFLEPRPHLRRQ